MVGDSKQHACESAFHAVVGEDGGVDLSFGLDEEPDEDQYYRGYLSDGCDCIYYELAEGELVEFLLEVLHDQNGRSVVWEVVVCVVCCRSARSEKALVNMARYCWAKDSHMKSRRL